jgi:hypothetical protein
MAHEARHATSYAYRGRYLTTDGMLIDTRSAHE